jgi:hypothetical protein
MAAECLRHFWLALARPKLFQSVEFAGRDIFALSRSGRIFVASSVAQLKKEKADSAVKRSVRLCKP